jgi:rhodanese-related sulfurtransferase
MKTLLEAVLLLMLAALAAMGSYLLHPAAPALYAVAEPLREDEVTVAQVQERWNGEVLWLDARPKEEFDKERIPGALLLNEQNFEALLLETLDTLQTNTKPVIIYCSGQRCDASRKVKEKLTQVVALDVCLVLKGGFPAWKAAQTP